jgi:co-chaperonin GroES (HSP10)
MMITKEEAVLIGAGMEEQALGRGYIALKPTVEEATKAGIYKPKEVTEKEARDSKNFLLTVVSVSPLTKESSPIQVGDQIRVTMHVDFRGAFESPVEGYEVVYVREHDVLTYKS